MRMGIALATGTPSPMNLKQEQVELDELGIYPGILVVLIGFTKFNLTDLGGELRCFAKLK